MRVCDKIIDLNCLYKELTDQGLETLPIRGDLFEELREELPCVVESGSFLMVDGIDLRPTSIRKERKTPTYMFGKEAHDSLELSCVGTEKE